MAPAVPAEPPAAKLAEMLPNELGKFRQLPSMRPLITLAKEGILNPEIFRARTDPATSPYIGAETEYLSAAGEKLTIEIIKFTGDSDAYSFFSLIAKMMQEAEPVSQLSSVGVGTVSVKSSRGIAFFKGTTFVRVTQADSKSRGSDSAIVLARLFADRIDNDGGAVPVLLKHLPDWNDRRIVAKIQELWKQGQPAPTAYRRVGNYSVFVFNAPNEQAANQLIDQVKYEQVVQWLGDNPNWLERAQRHYTETLLGTFIAVIKASGLAAVLCFGVGGFFGALLFARRRAQQKTSDAFSDAGGMMRLNLDEMTAETNAARLVGPRMSDKL